MSENSKIEWTDHTFNPWIGCTKVSPACDHCYAEVSSPSRALGVRWGAGQPRRLTSESNWKEPLRWNARHEREMAEWVKVAAGIGGRDEAIKRGIHPPRRQRVFCASLADVFDNEVPREWRYDLLWLISNTPNLDWLLLTKRIGNAHQMLTEECARMGFPWSPKRWHNVWIGATICNQEEADRDIPKLLRVPAAVRFLSMEPLLGPVDLGIRIGRNFCGHCHKWNDAWTNDGFDAVCSHCLEPDRYPARSYHGINWVIVGGESGQHARPMHPDWARSLRDQCAAAGVPFLFKQWGEWRPAQTIAEATNYPTIATNREVAAKTEQARRHPPASGCYHLYGQVESMIDGSGVYAHLDCAMFKAGKKAAGRLLDGRTHDEFPKGAA